jgi:hypothetical protein
MCQVDRQELGTSWKRTTGYQWLMMIEDFYMVTWSGSIKLVVMPVHVQLQRVVTKGEYNNIHG